MNQNSVARLWGKGGTAACKGSGPICLLSGDRQRVKGVMESRMVVSRGWGWGELLSDGNGVSVEDYRQALEVEGGDGTTMMRTYLKPPNCALTHD